MWDCIVLGLGGVGSFALRAVAHDMSKGTKPVKILGLERFALGHAKGSSHGKSRVYRKAYFEHPSYVPWCTYSEQEFRKVEQSAGVSLLSECGVLVVAPEAHRAWLDNCLAAAREHGVPVEELDLTELQRRFPQYRYSRPDMCGVYEPGGGLVRPERAVKAALQEARKADGVEIWENCRVMSMKEKKGEYGENDHVELVVTKQNPESSAADDTITILARKVLMGAGAWTSELLPVWSPQLRPIRILQSWVDISAAGSSDDDRDPLSLYSVSNMPCSVIVNPEELPIAVYCLPADPDADDDSDDSGNVHDKYKTCVKLGIHGDIGGHGQIDPNQNHQMKVTPQEQAHMDAAIQAALHPNVAMQLPCMETLPCMYTMTADEHFLIGVPKGFTNVCAIAGLSGHGFKMAPALGQMLADFATGKDWDHWKVDFCSPKRFGV